jgi:Transposase DDE domain.
MTNWSEYNEGLRRRGDLTTDDVGDPTALPDLLDHIDGPVDLFLADGAYDGEPTSDLLAARFGSLIEVTSQKRNPEPQCGQRSDGT